MDLAGDHATPHVKVAAQYQFTQRGFHVRRITHAAPAAVAEALMLRLLPFSASV